jgi:hypothetical protein
MDNESRLRSQLIFQVTRTTKEILEHELSKTNYAIDRKWAILDEYSATWDWTKWKNWKDSLYADISYREYIWIILEQLK